MGPQAVRFVMASITCSWCEHGGLGGCRIAHVPPLGGVYSYSEYDRVLGTRTGARGGIEREGDEMVLKWSWGNSEVKERDGAR